MDASARINVGLGLVCFIVLTYASVQSLSWRMAHDAPMMVYQGWLLVEQGFLPYRDWFDMNMPGTYAIYGTLGWLSGFDESGLRLLDMLVVATIAGLSAWFMRPVGRGVAWVGPLFFPLFLLDQGPSMMLQRETLALVPILAGLVASVHSGPIWRRALLTGLFFGCAATIKPHLLIGLLAPGAVILAASGDRRQGIRWIVLGLAGPLLLMVVVLLGLGIFGDFLHSLAYLRFYGDFTGEGKLLDGWERLSYLGSRVFLFNYHHLYVLGALFGISVGLRDACAQTRQRTWMLLGLIASYAVYPVFSGQFWQYHPYPMLLFCFLATGLLGIASGVDRWLPRLGLLLLVGELCALPQGVKPLVHDGAVPKQGRPDAIASYLRDYMEPGDLVQPLDWVEGGVVHGMLLARAAPATKYLYEFHFFHHVDEPYIINLRRDFLTQLDARRPRFIVSTRRKESYFQGKDTVFRWGELDEYVKEHYEVARGEARFVIWERR